MKLTVSIAAAFAGLIFCLGGPASMAGEGRSISSVNGGVHAAPGETYDSLSTVNGDVHMGSGASAESAKTVNGEVRLEENARVGNASTVNGSLKVGAGAVGHARRLHGQWQCEAGEGRARRRRRHHRFRRASN